MIFLKVNINYLDTEMNTIKTPPQISVVGIT